LLTPPQKVYQGFFVPLYFLAGFLVVGSLGG
jgi:hypothetical protein